MTANFADFAISVAMFLRLFGQASKVTDLPFWIEGAAIPANLPAASGKLSEDLARLVNNDSVSGVLKGIKDGKIAFTTSFASLDIPLERVGQIELAQAKIEKPVLVPGEVRATFAGRGSVTFTLENWDANQVTGYSPNLGRMKFSPAAFSQVEFNLDKQKAASDDLFGF